MSSITQPMNGQGFLPPLEIVIEDDVFIGAGVTILAGRRVGRGSIVAAGAVVTHDVPPWTVVAGNPAVVVKQRGSTESFAVSSDVPAPRDEALDRPA